MISATWPHGMRPSRLKQKLNEVGAIKTLRLVIMSGFQHCDEALVETAANASTCKA